MAPFPPPAPPLLPPPVYQFGSIEEAREALRAGGVNALDFNKLVRGGAEGDGWMTRFVFSESTRHFFFVKINPYSCPPPHTSRRRRVCNVRPSCHGKTEALHPQKYTHDACVLSVSSLPRGAAPATRSASHPR